MLSPRATATPTSSVESLRDDICCGIQAIKTLIHELAHVQLHAEADLSQRSVPEVEADSVAFVVSSALGLDSSDYSFAYVARWAAGDAELVAATAQRVTATARTILESLEQHPAMSAHGDADRPMSRVLLWARGNSLLRTECILRARSLVAPSWVADYG